MFMPFQKCPGVAWFLNFVIFFAAQSVLGAVSLPFYDAFPLSYAEGERLGDGNSGAYWDVGNSTGTGSPTNTAAAALTFSGLVNSNTSRGILMVGTPSSNRDRGVALNPVQTIDVSSPTLYVSFLLNVQALPSSTRRVAYFRNSTSAGNPSAAVFLNSSGQLQIVKSGTTPDTATTSSLSPGTHLVVLRYQWVSAASDDDAVSLWLDPGSLGVDEGSVPSPTISTASGSDVSTLNAFFISQRTDASGTLWLDEVRIATNWAAVTPSDGSSPPTEPYLSRVLMTPDGLVVMGTNGPANGTYLVLRSTNVVHPQFQWTVVATNHFAANGDFAYTNPVSPADVQMYFRLLLGSEPPPSPAPPSITLQPTNHTVIIGQDVTFEVRAEGASLHYQWYFNTNTPLADANSASLTLTNVQETNAGTYSVVITNIAGTTNSDFALLTVNPVPVEPTFTTEPTNQTVSAGDPVTLIAEADGTEPLFYQWFFNTNTVLAGETNHTLMFASVQATNEGVYSVRVTNLAGIVFSTNAVLTVLSPPVILTQPQDRAVVVSNSATFSVQAVGTSPLAYQWYFNTNTVLSNETNYWVTISNALTNDVGGYSVIITNQYGSITSAVAQLSLFTNVPYSAFNLYGFGQDTTGGGVVSETSAAYRKVTNALDFITALADKTGTIKVIEITTNLDLGYNEVGPDVQAFSIFREHNTPLLHPRLLQTGVSLIDIQQKDGLTIFSANGATIRHANLNIKDSANIIVRNLKFDEMWEWDESSKGDYDRNDWDFITLGNGGGTVSNAWIDHCTFTKAYDGICDMKGGCFNLTFSWNKYVGDDGATNPNSFVWQQINSLESNKTSYAMYNFLRTHGFSTTDIVTIIQGHDKTHLIGATSLNSENAQHRVTFHHQWYMNPWDRLPRLRAGNVHNYNIYVDDTQGLAAKRLRDMRAAAMSSADRNTLNNTYSFNPFLNGTISTEDGAILVENSVYIDCLTPLRNNQTDPSDPTYTGKIMALDSIYHFDNTDGSTIDYRGSSTNAPGDAYFGPVQAPVIPFSWNLPGNQLPYTYVMDDPSQLKDIVTDPNTGAGAGVLTWARTNWMRTVYSP